MYLFLLVSNLIVQIRHKSGSGLPIEIIFTIVFISILAISLYFMRLRPKEWDSLVIQSDLSYTSIKESLISNTIDTLLLSVPSIFLMIGLLGTFINLSIAIGSIPTENISEGSLNEVLQTLGSKFKISIWGIVLNIGYRIPLNIIYGNELSRIVKKKFNKAKEEKDKISRNDNEKVNKNSELIVQSINQLTKDFASNMEVLIRTSMLGIQQNNTDNKKLVESFSTFINNVGSLERSSNQMSEAANKMSEAAQVLRDDIPKTTQSLKDTTNEFSNNSKEFIQAVRQFEDKSAQVLDGVQKSISGFNQTVENSLNDFSKNVNTSLTTASRATTDSALAINENISGFNQTVTKSFDGFSLSVNGTLDKVSNAIAVSTNSLGESTNKLEASIEKSLGEINKILIETTKKTSLLNNTINKQNEVLSKLTTAFEEMTGLNAELKNSISYTFNDEKGNMNLLKEEVEKINNHLPNPQTIKSILEQQVKIKNLIESTKLNQTFEEVGIILRYNKEILLDIQSKIRSIELSVNK